MAFLCLKDEKLRSILLSPSNLKAGCLVAIFEKRGREKENASIVVSSIMAKHLMAKIIDLQMGMNVNLPFDKDFFAIRISRLSTNQQCLCHSSVQFSSNSAQDVRRRRNPETIRNIIFLENIQLLHIKYPLII